ncbi:TPA: GyrI-like domain-containing protein [Pseudomonas putida]|nr:GyrI-like domain-containing protein [Pseudomonas putida]
MAGQTCVSTTAPRFERGESMLIAGFGGRFSRQDYRGIHDFWVDFFAHLDRIPGTKGQMTYGVCCNFDGKGGFDYIAGIEVSQRDELPDIYRCIEIQPRQYAVFVHDGWPDVLAQSYLYILDTWLPQSGYERIWEAPIYERYTPDFIPKDHTGSVEIWLPISK